MSGGKFSVPNDRVCIVLFGMAFAFIGLFAVLIVLSEVLLGITDVSGDDFWGTLLILVLFTVFAVIGISEVIRGLTIRSERLSLKKPVAADGLGTIVTGARFFYTWGCRVFLFLLAGGILAGGLVVSSMSLSTIRWSAAHLTIWPAIFAGLLVLPTIALIWLNLRRMHT